MNSKIVDVDDYIYDIIMKNDDIDFSKFDGIKL